MANPLFSGALCARVTGKPLGATAQHLAKAPVLLLLPGHDSSSFTRLHLDQRKVLNRYAPARSNLRLASTKATFAIGDTGDLYYREMVHARLSYQNV